MLLATSHTRTFGLSIAAALLLHASLVLVLSGFHPRETAKSERPVEFEISDPPLPPPVPEAPAPAIAAAPPTPSPPMKVALVPRPKVSAPRPSATATPPPPNQTPPPQAAPAAPPVFGITMSSVVAGTTGVGVPIGNTTMTKPGTGATTPAQPYAGPGGDPVAFVPEIYIVTRPRVLFEVNSADIYPEDAKAMGIEGSVKLSVGLDDKGSVIQVKIVKRAGHGFDEAAVEALKKCKFSPAISSAGRAVPYRFEYTYKFQLDN